MKLKRFGVIAAGLLFTGVVSPLSVTQAQTSVPDAVAADAPVAYWKLDDVSGTVAADLATPPHPGTYYNSVTYSTDRPSSKFAGSRLFGGGACDGVQVDGSVTQIPNAVTLEAWVKPAPDSGVLLFRYLNYGYHFTMSNGRLGYSAYGGGAGIESARDLRDGKWHHVAVVRTNGTPSMERLYIDGVLDTEVQAAAGPWNTQYGGFSQQAAIGRDGISCNGIVPSYRGHMAGFAIFDKALTDTQVKAHYEWGAPPNTDPSGTSIKVRLPSRDVCLLAGAMDALVGSCSASGANWRVVVQPNGRFNLFASDRCLRSGGQLGETCTDFFTLIRDDGLREIRWGTSASDYPWEYDGSNFAATPCLAAQELVLGALTSVYVLPNCPANRAATGWEIELPVESASYGLGDVSKVDPRIGLVVVLFGTGVRGIRCTGTVIDDKNTVATGAHCLTGFGGARFEADQVYFIPGYSGNDSISISAPYGVYRAEKVVSRQGVNAKTTDWAFLKMVPETHAVAILQRVLGTAVPPKPNKNLSEATGYIPIRFLSPELRRVARREPLISKGYPSNLSNGIRPISCRSPKRVGTDTFACLMKQGSSGGPVLIAGEVRGTNEGENEGMLRPALFGIHACDDYRSLVGGSCR
jgi:Concanavalin A-like lectin/glucanases superfamily/Trypsin